MKQTTTAIPPAVARRRVRQLVKSGLLGERIEEAGLTHTDVARHVGVSQPTVWRWVNGRVNPRGEHAAALLELLDS
jgi:predicted transcriptional regulator